MPWRRASFPSSAPYCLASAVSKVAASAERRGKLRDALVPERQSVRTVLHRERRDAEGRDRRGLVLVAVRLREIDEIELVRKRHLRDHHRRQLAQACGIDRDDPGPPTDTVRRALSARYSGAVRSNRSRPAGMRAAPGSEHAQR